VDGTDYPAEVDLRASDSERDLVAAELGEHFQDGRLDQAEFDERLTFALNARTRRDLAALLADLPKRGTLRPDAGLGTGARQRPPLPARLLPVLIPLLFATVVVAGFAAGGGPHRWAGGGPWPLLWLWWIIPVVVFRMRRGAQRFGPGGYHRGQ
jgi:hypothetical protein